MNRRVKEMLVRSSVEITASWFRLAGLMAREIGMSIAQAAGGFAQEVSSAVYIWLDGDRMREEEQRRAALAVAEEPLRALFVNLLGEDAWKLYEQMRAERGRAFFDPEGWAGFLEAVFGKEKLDAAARAAKKEPEKPAAS